MKYFFLLSTLFFLFSCNKEQVIHTNSQGEMDLDTVSTDVIVDRVRFQEINTSTFSIDTAFIKGDIMTITIGGGGCSGNSWKVELIDSEKILKSYPSQRSLKVMFKNEELCEAYFIKQYSFNISKLKVGATGKIFLNLNAYKGKLLYEY